MITGFIKKIKPVGSLLLYACTFFSLHFSAVVNAQEKTDPAIIKDFMNKRFGMFIHWGPVSLRGTEIGWSRGNQVNVAEYDSLYKEFNPVLFNADTIVAAAKNAGMKYLTITARHHDGFCLWPTAYTDFNIMHSPYKKDIVGALATACKKAGIKFCIYYSILDWHHPDYPIHTAKTDSVDPGSDMARYIVYIKNQLKELITKYDPYMLWFDGAWEKPWTEQMGKDMYAYLKKIKPSVIINNRLGKAIAGVANDKIDMANMVGDYDTPEQTVGRMNMEMPWESCFTICNQWSWRPNDKMKSLKECVGILSQTAGGNGNLLLNVGPMPDGRIEVRQVTRLKEIGDWLKTNGEAVYNTSGGPYESSATYASTRKGNNIYLHVLKTDTAAIELKDIPGRKMIRAHCIDGESISVEKRAASFVVLLPKKYAAKPSYVIVLEMDGDVQTIPILKN